MIDLSGGAGAAEAVFRRHAAAALERAVSEIGIGTPCPDLRGDELLRRRLAALLDLPFEHVTVTYGVRAAAFALAAAAPAVICERPTFLGVPDWLAASGAHVRFQAWDELAAGDERTLFWVTSPSRNPDGASLGAETVRRLEALAAAGHLVVQNEIYRPFLREPAVRLAGAIGVGSLHKLAGVGSQIGWLAHPRLDDVLDRRLLGYGPPPLWQRAWAHFLAAAAEPLRAWREEAVAARNAFAGGVGIARREAVFALLPLAPEVSEPEALERLAAAGVQAADGRAFRAEGTLRFSFVGVAPAAAADAAKVVRRLGLTLSDA